jgi:hypothetical protein
MKTRQKIIMLQSFILYQLSKPIDVHSQDWIPYSSQLIRAQTKLERLLYKSRCS